jgi:hypothetical protein
MYPKERRNKKQPPLGATETENGADICITIFYILINTASVRKF